jgi:hypothetical protein
MFNNSFLHFDNSDIVASFHSIGVSLGCDEQCVSNSIRLLKSIEENRLPVVELKEVVMDREQK